MPDKTSQPFELDLDLESSANIARDSRPPKHSRGGKKGAIGSIGAVSDPLANESQLDKARREKAILAKELEEVKKQLAMQAVSRDEKSTLKIEYERRIVEMENELNAKSVDIRVMEREIDRISSELEARSVTQTMIMPVSREEVTFTLMELDPDDVVISGHNARDQEFLTEDALSDILPSIRDVRQYDAGYVSNANPDELKVCDGSRRRAAAKIASKPFLAWVGNIPEIDMHELSEVLNKSKTVSYWERAKHIKFLIDNTIYDSWRKAMDVYSLSQGNSDRYKKLADLDSAYIHCFPSPNDVPLNFGMIINKLEQIDSERTRKVASEVSEQKAQMLKNGVDRESIVDTVLKSFKSIEKRNVVPKLQYESSSNSVKAISAATGKGLRAVKVEKLSDDQAETLLNWLKETFELKETK